MKYFVIALTAATLIAAWADGSSASEHKGYTEAQCKAADSYHWRAGSSYTRKKDGRVINVRAHCRKGTALRASQQYQAYLSRSPEGISADGKITD